ncbi:MAG: MBL fold metallo-hydrolase [Clostridia bacterium]|nr:MBL fold metallo-hydrolase [Clostridia bacterium]
MAGKVKKLSPVLVVFLAILCFLVGAAAGFLGAARNNYLSPVDEYAEIQANGRNGNGKTAASTTGTQNGGNVTKSDEIGGNLQIHFLELGNYYTGDCVYIKAGDTDILIDAGSKYSSVPTISAYLNEYVEDNKLEYVIVTHAHEDHYAGFAANVGIFDLYECEVIIDFAQTNQKPDADMYTRYIAKRDAEIAAGATHYTALDCIEQDKTDFAVAEGINMKILNSYYYANKDSSGENNHSVCMLLTEGENNYLFTGDLEEKGEKKLVEMNDLPEVVLYKAGHHGSKTSSSDALLSVIKPQIVCVCCCAGSNEYRAAESNKFPSQAFVDRIAPYTDRVYVTTIVVSDEDKTFQSMNGNITVCSDGEKIWVVCSASDLLLRETAWFEEKRTCPAAWQK